ncbi:glycosyltransferase [Gracilibacillus sp. D59]|uniref:glycosyltransferase n=1 Tax=Gracilibacillus sp. D59 TaxID=3457434 RepID=UPI003FCC61B6
MKKVLFVMDSLDPGLSIEHQLHLIHRQLDPDADTYLKLLNYDSLFLQQLNKHIHILLPISHIISSARKDTHFPRGWRFSMKSRPVPLHIRKAYYNYPTIVRLYWQYISRGVPKSHIHYDEAISLSAGIPSFYLRDKVKAEKKIYYFPVRQFQQVAAPIVEQLSQQDFIYTASKSMYRELKANNLQVKYYADPYYHESLYRVLQLLDAKRYHPRCLSILSANNLQNKKHIEEFIRMSIYLVKQNTPFRWYFYGDNQNETIIREELKTHQLEDHVVFIGDIANVFQYLETADVYVEWEKHSSIYFEAITLQKPIIDMKNESFDHNHILPKGWCNIVQAIKSIKKI